MKKVTMLSALLMLGLSGCGETHTATVAPSDNNTAVVNTTQSQPTQPKPQPTQKPQSQPQQSQPKPQPKPSPQPKPVDNPAADIAKDKALIASKGMQATGQYIEVPDGFGKTLYAFSATTGGDGSNQQVFFFINDTYIGTDTAEPHGPVLEMGGEGTGSIGVVYAVYKPTDPVATPSGTPFTIVYHWNGSRLTPNAPFQNQHPQQ
jgi:hypothetical protein